MQVLYLGRAPRIKETLPDFREKCRVTQRSRVFRGLTGSQRTPGFGASQCLGVLVELLVIFRDKGLGVPIISLLLDFFSVKESVEGFLYIAKHSNKKADYFGSPVFPQTLEGTVFLYGWSYQLTKKTRLVFQSLGLPPRTFVSSRLRLIRFSLRQS